MTSSFVEFSQGTKGITASYFGVIVFSDKGIEWLLLSEDNMFKHCVITRTAKQEDAEASRTSQVPHTKDMIGSACGGSQAVPITSNESMFP
ncbi:uncharacterized protein [Solanum lycopersicum]|uniref:uncharacterized protein n=1 Tax=Solanum lycopersicum TaxID=4081 RepID=UPI00374A368E